MTLSRRELLRTGATTAVLVPVAGGASGCATLLDLLDGVVKKPELALRSFEITKTTLTSFSVRLVALMKNPNPFGFRLDGLDWGVKLAGGAVAKGADSMRRLPDSKKSLESKTRIPEGPSSKTFRGGQVEAARGSSPMAFDDDDGGMLGSMVKEALAEAGELGGGGGSGGGDARGAAASSSSAAAAAAAGGAGGGAAAEPAAAKRARAVPSVRTGTFAPSADDGLDGLGYVAHMHEHGIWTAPSARERDARQSNVEEVRRRDERSAASSSRKRASMATALATKARRRRHSANTPSRSATTALCSGV
jgi:hypothetical protein